MDIAPLCHPEPQFRQIIEQSSGFRQVTSGITFEPDFSEAGIWVHPVSKNWYFVRISKAGDASLKACIEEWGDNFSVTATAP